MDNDCWLYAGIINTAGYGVILVKLDGKWKMLRAHRVVYENMVGEIPTDLVCDHLCRNRSCINPSHIEPVSNGENLRRGHTRMTHCIHGHEFDKANTIVYMQGRRRRCRTCHYAGVRRYKHRIRHSQQ